MCGKTFFLAGTAIIALSLGASGYACAQTIGDLVTVSSGTPFTKCKIDQVGSQPGTNYPASAIEPWIAVDPTTAGRLLIGVQQDRWSDGGSRGLRAAISNNGGRNWTRNTPEDVSLCTGGVFQRSTDPWTGFGLDGTAYFFSLAFNNNPTPTINGRSALLVSRSTNHGETWGYPITVIDDTDPLAFNDKNSITADSQIAGNAYTVWDRLYGPADAFKAPGGSDEHGSVAATSALSDDGIQRTRNRIAKLRAAAAAKASGKATAAVAGPETFGPTWFSRTTNSGQFWTRPVPIYDPGVNAQTIANVVVSMPSGELMNFFTNITDQGELSIAFIRSRDHGLSWTEKRETVTPTSGAGAVTPDTQQPIRDANILFSVSADQATGNLYVLWQDIPSGPGAQLSILFSQSTDNGRTWSRAVRVNKTPANRIQPLRGQGFNGTIVAAGRDTLVATYYDFRNDTFARKQELTDVWGVFCTPSAAKGDCTKASNWGREARLTERSFDITEAPLTASGFFLGDYFGLVAQGTNVWPAFTAVTGPGETSLFTRPIHLGAVSVATE